MYIFSPTIKGNIVASGEEAPNLGLEPLLTNLSGAVPCLDLSQRPTLNLLI